MSTQFSIEWCEKKNADWIKATLKEGNQVIQDVSINRLDKKTGKVAFEKFDEIMPGGTIEGELWRSDKGACYLFAPRPQSAPKVGGFGGGVKAAQERKEVMIEKAQERKSDSIAYFNSVNCAIELVKDMKLDAKALQEELVIWREWFLSEYRKYEAKDVTEKRNAC